MNTLQNKSIIKILRKMKYIYSITILLFTLNISAQQDPQYTQYMFNTLAINSAYAGSTDNLSATLLYRNQWVGFDGSPKTLAFSAHSPIGSNVGLGLSIVRDEIFITSENYFDVNFSYTLNLSNKTKIALGIKAGGHLLDVNFDEAVTGPFSTLVNNELANINNFSPQLGFGAYLYRNNWYLGLSVPNVLETEHFSENNGNTLFIATERQHYFLMGGYVHNLSENIKLKPAFLVKAVEGAPLSVDLSINTLLYKKFILGAAYRWDSAVSALAGFYLANNIQFGVAYDYETTNLRTTNNGSYELFIRIDFAGKRAGINNPRFF